MAHVGYELLLDATLAGGDADDAYQRAFAAFAAAGSTLAVLRPAGHEQWRNAVARFATSRRGATDGDPAAIAERLVAILRDRPRLALAAEDAPLVAAALERHAGDVHRSAPTVLTAVTARATVDVRPDRERARRSARP